MAQCVTCGAELHPERAVKYDYCTAPDCQQRNLKGLTMVAVGMNKAADEYLILDEQTQQDMASGKYRDQRRGLFGPAAARTAALAQPNTPAPAADRPPRRRGPSQPRPADRRAWTPSQERLALLYNSQGLRPAEIAAKLGVRSHLVTQIILAARNRGKS